MFHAVQAKYFQMTEQDALKKRNADNSLLYKPHTVEDKIHRNFYTSPVTNSHQYPPEQKIRPPTFENEIPPHTSQLLKDIDNEPQYIGKKKYTRKTLPNKMTTDSDWV